MLSISGAVVSGQLPPLPEHEAFVTGGLEANLGLQARALEVEALAEALEEARAAWRPRLDASARLTVADGGRTLDFPLGDLLNPVYASLNGLLGRNDFPAVANQSIPLLQTQEQDTRLSLVQPVYNPAINLGTAARAAQQRAGEAGLEDARRVLRRGLSEAYWRLWQAAAAARIFDDTEAAVAENLRVTERRAEAGAANQAEVLRARAELFDVRQQAARARERAAAARRYANFLRHAPLDAPVAALPAGAAEAAAAALQAGPPPLRGVAGRADLRALAEAAEATNAQAELARAERRPTVALALDAGTTGANYGLDDSDGFYTASLVGQLNLSDGGASKRRERQARLRAQSLRLRLAEAEAGAGLELSNAVAALRVELEALAAARERLAAARESYRLTERLYASGQTAQLGLLDARTARTAAELGESAALYEVLVVWAAVEGAQAGP